LHGIYGMNREKAEKVDSLVRNDVWSQLKMRLKSAFNHVLFEKHASNGNTSGVLWQKQQKPKKKGEICEGRQEKNFGGLISTLSIEIVFLNHVKKEKTFPCI